MRSLQKGTPTKHRPVCLSLSQSSSSALYCCSILWMGTLQKGTLAHYRPVCLSLSHTPSSAFQHFVDGAPSERYPDPVPASLSQSAGTGSAPTRHCPTKRAASEPAARKRNRKMLALPGCVSVVWASVFQFCVFFLTQFKGHCKTDLSCVTVS